MIDFCLTAAFFRLGNQQRDLIIYQLQKISVTLRTVLLIALPFSFGMMAVGGNLAKLLFPSIRLLPLQMQSCRA